MCYILYVYYIFYIIDRLLMPYFSNGMVLFQPLIALAFRNTSACWWFKPLRKILMEMGPPPAAVDFGFVRWAAGRMSAFWRSGCRPEQANFPK